MSKLSNPENIIVREGYFPEMTQYIDETFCFVNLDMDLYDPMYNGLEYFYNRMADGGVILLHDYFHNGLQGVKTAVKDYENKNNTVLKKMPIGDHCSLAIIK